MRRIHVGRPGRVARVSGRRIGEKGIPRERVQRQRARIDFELERKWNDSGWILNQPSLLDVGLSFQLTAKPKTSQITISAGDTLLFENAKGLREIMIVNKVVSAKGATTYVIERACHKTVAQTWKQLGTSIYVDHP